MKEEIFYKNIIELVSDIIWEVNKDCIFTEISMNTDKPGFPPGEIIGKKLSDIINIEISGELLKHLNKAAADRKNIDRIKIPVEIHQGIEKIFIVAGVPLLDDKKRFSGYRGVARDITENKVNSSSVDFLTRNVNNSAGSHLLSEQQFRKMFESAPQGIAIADSDGFILHANNTWKKMFGFTNKDMKNMHMNRFRSDENRKHDRNLYDSLMKNKITSYRLERLFRRKDEQTFWCDLTVKVVDDPESPRPYAIGLYVDITDRKIIEDDLRSSEEFTRILINESPFGIGAISNGRLIFVNNAFASMFGYDHPSGMNNIKINQLVTKGDAKKFLTKDGKEKPDVMNNTIIEIRLVKKNGTKFTASCKFEMLRIKDNPVLIVFTEDITERKKNEGRIKKFREGLEKLVEERTDEIKKLNRQILITQEEERQRIACDLHDGVGQTMLAAKLAFSSSERAKPDSRKGLIDHGMMLMDMASQELREIYTGLYPSILRELGLGDTINWFIRNSLSSAGINVKCDNRISGPVPDFVSINIYRIIQELFNNIIKHSGADCVDITLVEKPDFIISVTDNGKGFNVNEILNQCRGSGLMNIKQRIEYMDGKLYISSNPGSTSFVIIIPGDNR